MQVTWIRSNIQQKSSLLWLFQVLPNLPFELGAGSVTPPLDPADLRNGTTESLGNSFLFLTTVCSRLLQLFADIRLLFFTPFGRSGSP